MKDEGNEWHDMFYLPNSKGVCPDDEHTIKEINDKQKEPEGESSFSVFS